MATERPTDERHFETPPPLTDDDLAQLHTMLADYDAHTDGTERAPNGTPTRLYIADDLVSQALPALLAEVARLRTREAALVEVAQAVADHAGYYSDNHFRQCAFCDNGALESRIIAHWHECEVTKARALLATEGDADAD